MAELRGGWQPMYDEHKIKSQRPILNIVAILDTMQWTIYSCFRFLSLLGVLDDEEMATISVQLQLLQATVDEWRPGRGEELINSVVQQVVPLAERIEKALKAIQDNAVASFYLRQLHEVAKLIATEDERLMGVMFVDQGTTALNNVEKWN